MTMNCPFCGHELSHEQEVAEMEKQYTLEMLRRWNEASMVWRKKYCPIIRNHDSLIFLMMSVLLAVASLLASQGWFVFILLMYVAFFVSRFVSASKREQKLTTEAKARFYLEEPDKYKLVFGPVFKNPA